MPAEAQPPIPTLPADLLFTTGSPAPRADFSLNMIMRVDAETFELSPLLRWTLRRDKFSLSNGHRRALCWPFIAFCLRLTMHTHCFRASCVFLDRAGALQVHGGQSSDAQHGRIT